MISSVGITFYDIFITKFDIYDIKDIYYKIKIQV